jgi:hypothetical protein
MRGVMGIVRSRYLVVWFRVAKKLECTSFVLDSRVRD